MRVAFYGGSFNPVHVSHVMAATYLLSVGDFDRVLVVPVYSHAFDKQLAGFDDRVRMCELAMGWIPGVEVDRIEETLDTPSLTLRTLRALGQQHTDWKLRLVIGADVVAETEKWHAFDEVKALAPPYVLGRVGVSRPDVPPPVLPGVSSTRVRQLMARMGEADADRELAQLVPRRVLEHVRERGLYR